MHQLSYSSFFWGLLTVASLGACDPVNSGSKAWGITGEGKEPMPSPSTGETEAKRTTEAFIKALREKKPKDLLALSSVASTFQLFLPENFDSDGKEESIANAAAESEDPRLKKLAQSTFVMAYPGETPGKLIAVVSEPPPVAEQPGLLHALEVEMVDGKYRVVQIGSDAFGDSAGKWLVSPCTAFAAPFKVPAKLSDSTTFEGCSASLTSFKQRLTSKSPEAQQTLQDYIEGQPYIEQRKQAIIGEAKQSYGTGEDPKAFQFGLTEGETLRLQFILAMGSYCGCLPSEKGGK